MENCSTKYEIHAPAKLTLSLAIKRPLISLHELEAEMVTIDLQDTLRFREAGETMYQGAYPILLTKR